MEKKTLMPLEVLALALGLIFFIYIGWFLGYNKLVKLPNIIHNQNQTNDKIDTAASLLLTNYYSNPDTTISIADSMIAGMVSGLNDPYTYYADQTRYEEIKSFTQKSNIDFKKLNDNTYYLKFDWFTKNLKDELSGDLANIPNSENKILILDFRENLGGNFESVLWFLDNFLNNINVVTEKYNTQEVLQNTSPTTSLASIKIVMVVSKETSSGGELVSAVFQENNRAKIIGEKTYGKNTIGDFFEFPDGSAIHISIGKWVTANGVDINKTGVIPDVVIDSVGEKTLNELLQFIP